MTPLRLQLSNFMGHRATAVDFADARLAVFVGENGAGKSAVSSEAIEFALFGRSRLAVDDLVTWGESEMNVVLEFDHAGERHRVTRGRSLRSGGKSFLELVVDAAGVTRPLTGATIAETQASIERLLGMDHATFRSAVLLKQADMARFARATAGERKRILGQVLGLDVWERAAALARERAREAGLRVTWAETAVEAIDARLAGRAEAGEAVGELRARVEQLELQASIQATNQSERERALHGLNLEEAGLLGAEAEVRALADRWRRASERRKAAQSLLEQTPDKRPAEPVALEVAEGRFEDARQRLQEARQAFETEQEAHRAQTAKADAQRAGLVALVRDLEAAAKSLEPVTCPHCGRTFETDPSHVADRLHKARQELLHAPEIKEPLRVATLRGQMARRETDLREAQVAIYVARIAEAEAEIATVEEQGRAARERASRLAPLREERTRLELELRTVVASALELRREANRAAQQLGAARADLEALERDRAEREVKAAEVVAERAKAGQFRRLVEALGPAGVPARIVEGVLPELAAEASTVLADTLPGWGVELRAQRAKRDGGMAEALDVIVLRDGAPRPFEALSGGQETIFVLALALALSRVAARRSGAPVRFVALDEPAWLDRANSRAFGQALRGLAHRGDLALVSLVTHNEDLAEYGDQVHRVTVNGTGSVVELVG